MPREKRQDESVRESAPEPSEPLYTRRTTIGTVKYWRYDKGHGAIASEETAPWDIWCHFSAIARIGGTATLPSGESFEVTYDDDGRAFSPTGEQVVSGTIQHAEPVNLRPGERVRVRYCRANQDSFKYIAQRVWRLDAPDAGA